MQKKTGQPAKESYAEDPKVPAGEILGVLPLLRGWAGSKGLPWAQTCTGCTSVCIYVCTCVHA